MQNGSWKASFIIVFERWKSFSTELDKLKFVEQYWNVCKLHLWVSYDSASTAFCPILSLLVFQVFDSLWWIRQWEPLKIIRLPNYSFLPIKLLEINFVSFVANYAITNFFDRWTDWKFGAMLWSLFLEQWICWWMS